MFQLCADVVVRVGDRVHGVTPASGTEAHTCQVPTVGSPTRVELLCVWVDSGQSLPT